MKNKLLFILILVFSGMQPAHSAGNSNLAVIKKFHYYKGHVGLLVNQPSMVNPDACDRKDWYLLPKEHPYYKEIVALIMAAHFSGQSLVFGLDGCTQNMPAIAHVVSEK